MERPARRNKYNARRTRMLGESFDSKGEAQRWLFLVDCQRRGVIQDLERQRPFTLSIGGHHICDYVSDFCYVLPDSGRFVVEDYKGVVTPEARLKIKLMAAIQLVDVRIVKSPTQEIGP